MRYAKSSLFNLERGTVGSRLSIVYYPTGDGGNETMDKWRERYTTVPWPVDETVLKKAKSKKNVNIRKLTQNCSRNKAYPNKCCVTITWFTPLWRTLLLHLLTFQM